MKKRNLKYENELNIKDTIRLQVPASVDVKKLLEDQNLTPTLHENIKNKIYYFLSLVVIHNDNYRLKEIFEQHWMMSRDLIPAL